MLVMISQPMNGKSNDEIYKERDEVLDACIRQNMEVLNTVFDDFGENDCVKNLPVFVLGKSLLKMSECDGVIFMPGWENARGCVVENMVAQKYGISRFYYDPSTKMILE